MLTIPQKNVDLPTRIKGKLHFWIQSIPFWQEETEQKILDNLTTFFCGYVIEEMCIHSFIWSFFFSSIQNGSIRTFLTPKQDKKKFRLNNLKRFRIKILNYSKSSSIIFYFKFSYYFQYTLFTIRIITVSSKDISNIWDIRTF